MEKLKMHTPDLAEENFRKLAAMFPNAVTETINDDGELVRAIDADVLRQEISAVVVEGAQERYQFTWPDKKKSVVLANQPIAKTLRLDREKSVGRDGTPGSIDSENIYIEGDNLEALKLLQETYLGKVKMIYIDPPYNTNGDFIYDDNFTIRQDEYIAESGQLDDIGNRLVQNLETNGRFHTDWLNMLYPRLRLAKDLLSDDGIICVSIDYHESASLRKIMDEVFGREKFVGEIYWESKTKSQNTVTAYNKLQPKAEMIYVYTKKDRRRFNLFGAGEKEYPLNDEKGVYREHVLEVMNAGGVRGRESMIFPISDGVSTVYLPEGKQWQLGQAQVAEYKEKGELFIRDEKVIIKMRPDYERTEKTEPFWGFFPKEYGTAESAKKELSELIGNNHGFETVKPVEVLRRLIYHITEKEDIVLDFFSGSGTTAEALIRLNAEDGGSRKFILVQVPEHIDKEGAVYKTITEIGEMRIKKAGEMIREESPLTLADLDIGFRVFNIDSSNMKDVYYCPSQYDQGQITVFADNIKEDRTPEDLLFQVMLDLGVLLSSKIDETEIAGKKVFSVADGYLIACFDSDVTEDTVKAIAKKHPFYAVFRDSGMANDSVAANFEQIFETYSPKTQRKVL